MKRRYKTFHLYMMLSVILLTILTSTANGQPISQDSYCLKLGPELPETYLIIPNTDTIALQLGTRYLRQLEKLRIYLSRYKEPSLVNSEFEFFRSITFSELNHPFLNIISIEKKNGLTEVTIKDLEVDDDSIILVHKKTYDLSTWTEFMAMADQQFLSQPIFHESRMGVHDGSTTVYEGRLNGQYHFLQRHAMSIKDPKLTDIHKFLLKKVGAYKFPNCKRDTRDH